MAATGFSHFFFKPSQVLSVSDDKIGRQVHNLISETSGKNKNKPNNEAPAEPGRLHGSQKETSPCLALSQNVVSPPRAPGTPGTPWSFPGFSARRLSDLTDFRTSIPCFPEPGRSPHAGRSAPGPVSGSGPLRPEGGPRWHRSSPTPFRPYDSKHWPELSWKRCPIQNRTPAPELGI